MSATECELQLPTGRKRQVIDFRRRAGLSAQQFLVWHSLSLRRCRRVVKGGCPMRKSSAFVCGLAIALMCAGLVVPQPILARGGGGGGGHGGGGGGGFGGGGFGGGGFRGGGFGGGGFRGGGFGGGGFRGGGFGRYG